MELPLRNGTSIWRPESRLCLRAARQPGRGALQQWFQAQQSAQAKRDAQTATLVMCYSIPFDAVVPGLPLSAEVTAELRADHTS